MTPPRFPRPLLALLAAAAAVAAACGGASKPTPAAAPPPVDEPAPPPAELTLPPSPAEPAMLPIPEAPPPAAAGAPRPHVAKALAFIPASANLIVGIDVPRLATTPLGDKLRQALVANGMPADCDKLAPAQFGQVVLGAGGGDLVAVVGGNLAEKVIIPCVDAGLKAKGGKLANKKIAGRKVYFATGSSDDNGWTTWTKTGVPLFATSEAGITAALDAKAAKVGPELAAVSAATDQSRVVWVAGVVEAAQLAALGVPGVPAGGNVTIRAWLDVATGSELDVVLGFSSAGDATTFAAELRALLEPMRPAPDTARVLAGLQLGVHGNEVHVLVRLDESTTKGLIDSMKVN